ncbi:tetraacyldisaccharide 4'-kinase [Helicobacter cholecystus]|uniref:tetraacyldisaccharide 4'-kinase n=1 Tax=Helicobacter cholecystus TaxID=45498 RepID=UPI002738B9ED|nr:tetraacyldisaccharide 4'-kinase [Helicobacter cholecystus]
MRIIDHYFYKPFWWQKIIIFLLLPLSTFYCIVSFLKRKISPMHNFGIPIISVGNLIVGGSGKTPFIIHIGKELSNLKIGVVSRGYKRKSKGLVIVSEFGKILCSQEEAGDEAYLIARSLKNASVIVCKKRKEAIYKAKEMGCDAVLLDDGFRFKFKKLNILLRPKLEPYYSFCLPSGMYREWSKSYDEADLIIKEGVEYTRIVEVLDATPKMLLLTAIANPMRLDEFLPQVVGKIYYPDHSNFKIEEIKDTMREYGATSLLVTTKDWVKLENTNLPLSILSLKLEVREEIIERIKNYIQEEQC